MLMILATLSACASVRQPMMTTAAGSAPIALAAQVQGHELGADENIRSVLLTSSEAMSVHLVQIRRGEAPHIHATHDLVVTLLRGFGVLHLGEQAIRMQAGDVAVVARGTRHFFVNEDDEPAVAFVSFAPPYDGKDQVPAP